MTWILLVMYLMCTLPLSSGTFYMNICKWSNEGCASNEECCSRRCAQSHPGTNFRCSRTGMGGLCLYKFHCGHRMDCGHKNRCCARHWATCVKDSDCCTRYYTCQEIHGFVYRKCLPRRKSFRSSAHAHRHSQRVLSWFGFVSFLNMVVFSYEL